MPILRTGICTDARETEARFLQLTLANFANVARFAYPEPAEGFTFVRMKSTTKTDRAGVNTSVTKYLQAKEATPFFKNFCKSQKSARNRNFLDTILDGEQDIFYGHL